MPYELVLPRALNVNDVESDGLRKTSQASGQKLSEIFMSDENIWQSVFKSHLHSESRPNFSVYRTPFDNEMENQHPDFFLHILYMKSSEKTLTRNYNA